MVLLRPARASIVVSSPPLLSVSLGGIPFCCWFLEITRPGASHLNLAGLTPPYPGQGIPDSKHLLHLGRNESQTKRRRRHSQQWSFSFPMTTRGCCSLGNWRLSVRTQPLIRVFTGPSHRNGNTGIFFTWILALLAGPTRKLDSLMKKRHCN